MLPFAIAGKSPPVTAPALHGCFITATGTDVGKTFIARALALALRARGQAVCAVKPMETGCDPAPKDAMLLAEACGRSELASQPGFYRAVSPLAPLAAALTEGHPPPQVSNMTQACRECLRPGDYLLVEGAGGAQVPISEETTTLDLMVALALPVMLVASDELGTLSHTLCAYESLQRRQLQVAAVVVNRVTSVTSASQNSAASNLRILQQRLPTTVLAFPRCEAAIAPADLAATAQASGLLATLNV